LFPRQDTSTVSLVASVWPNHNDWFLPFLYFFSRTFCVFSHCQSGSLQRGPPRMRTLFEQSLCRLHCHDWRR
jgi:hypothetical protein